jgi:hypothetical protein
MRPRHRDGVLREGRGKATLNVVYNGKMPDTIFTFPSSTTTLAAYTLVGG